MPIQALKFLLVSDDKHRKRLIGIYWDTEEYDRVWM